MSENGGCACGSATSQPLPGGGASPFVYAIGQVEARPSSLAVQKEIAQAAAGAIADPQAAPLLHGFLVAREHRYLARAMNWVLRVEGQDVYALSPRDPADLELLLEAIRPDAGHDMHLVIGVQAPLAGPSGGLPLVLVEHLYSFGRPALAASLGSTAPSEVLDLVLPLARNHGATPEARALNYLIMRDAGVYGLMQAMRQEEADLVAVDARPIDSRGRLVVEVLLSFVHRNRGALSRRAARVDVTELFPFLVAPFAPHVAVSVA
jgi:hypothetical protein